MNTEILSADKDPMGAAILDFQKQGKAAQSQLEELEWLKGYKEAHFPS